MQPVGWKFGAWRDVVLMEKPLGAGSATCPRIMQRMKNKTVAAWLTFLGGPLGLHRFYLYGPGDLLGWLLPIPTALGLYGIERVQQLGLDDHWSWVLIPLLGFTIAGCALTRHSVRPDDARAMERALQSDSAC